MEAVREYLNAVARVSFLGEAFRVKAENCTANLQPFIDDSTHVIQFEVCKPDAVARNVTLCASRRIEQEWRLHATCKVC